jgi:acyl-coenzyme A synthetase/AMP-(fatty) acid ligase
MIKSAGYRISATEVEEALFQSELLCQAAVIGISDEILGQSLKAFVVPQEGAICTPEALLAFCAEKLPRYMIPKSVEVLADLPKTPNGKIDYPLLRETKGR